MTLQAFDTGNLAFMLVAASLVMLLAPGLAFFYGGLVGRKNMLAVMAQCIAAMGWTTFLWWACGFSLVFSGGEGGVIGNFRYAFLNSVRPDSLIVLDAHTAGARTLPLLALFSYHLMLAIIPPVLVTGAFANRIKFPAFLVFTTLWLFFVYFPLAHMAWGNGLFRAWGVLDYAGGLVVHGASGFAALASVLYVGKRKYLDKGPHSLPLVALGTGLLWFGWYGLSAGSGLRLDAATLAAFANISICAALAVLTWLGLAWTCERKPRFAGLLTGAVAGLVASAPAAGYVSALGAAGIGLLAGAACYVAVALKHRLGLDDALDVWACHGIGGATGCLGTGLFATTAWNAGGGDGLFRGGVRLFAVQTGATGLALAYAFLFSFAALWLIDRVTGVQVTVREEAPGLDLPFPGDQAYL